MFHNIQLKLAMHKRVVINKALVALGSAALFSGSVVAQHHTAEAAPQTDTKSQVAAEAIKNSKRQGIQPIKDGSTAEGQGSGVKQTTRPEAEAERKAVVREARPHRESSQGGTPK